MAFPTTIDALSDPTGSDTLAAGAGGHAALHKAENDAIEALETKVGVNSSAVATSLDYLVKNTSSSNPGHKHTLADGASNVTATAAELNKLSGLTSVANELNITDGGETAERVLNVNCKCSAYLSTDQLNLTSGSWTKVLLDTEFYDIGSDFASNKFTAPVTGYYSIKTQVVMSTIVADKTYQLSIYINGVAARYASQTSPTTDSVYLNYAEDLYLTAGQYIELYARSNSGANTTDIVSGTIGTVLSIHLLSV